MEVVDHTRRCIYGRSLYSPNLFSRAIEVRWRVKKKNQEFEKIREKHIPRQFVLRLHSSFGFPIAFHLSFVYLDKK